MGVVTLQLYHSCAVAEQGDCGVAYLVIWVLEGNMKFLHGLENNLEGLNNVVKYYGLPLELLILAEALGVDELHLLQDGRLARLSGSCEAHCTSVRASGGRLIPQHTKQEELDLLGHSLLILANLTVKLARASGTVIAFVSAAKAHFGR